MAVVENVKLFSYHFTTKFLNKNWFPSSLHKFLIKIVQMGSVNCKAGRVKSVICRLLKILIQLRC